VPLAAVAHLSLIITGAMRHGAVRYVSVNDETE
jgi:hypothetical protein